VVLPARVKLATKAASKNLSHAGPPGTRPSAITLPRVRPCVHGRAALVVLGKYLGMFDERPQNSNVIYAISDEPMSAEEWKKQYVMDR
jgi:hypothetical protein